MDKGVSSIKLSCITAVSIGIGAVTVIYVWFWWNQKSQKPPLKWRQVGNLNKLLLYPIKSMGPVTVNSLDCTIIGPKLGMIGDRTFMVIDSLGQFVTARKYPMLTQISPSISGSMLTFSMPGKTSVTLDIVKLQAKKHDFQTSVWGAPITGRDCGDEIAKWLSQVFLQKDSGLRLVYYPLDFPSKPIRKADQAFTFIKSNDTGVYTDSTSYSLMNEISTADLNNRMETPIKPDQFRMNFIVKAEEAFEEDTWDWIKLGEVIFRNIRPCARCVMTTINPDTGEKSQKNEPLLTLKGYRQINDPRLRRYVGESPVMGIHVGLKGPPGIVRLGDPVYVGVS